MAILAAHFNPQIDYGAGSNLVLPGRVLEISLNPAKKTTLEDRPASAGRTLVRLEVDVARLVVRGVVEPVRYDWKSPVEDYSSLTTFPSDAQTALQNLATALAGDVDGKLDFYSHYDAAGNNYRYLSDCICPSGLAIQDRPHDELTPHLPVQYEFRLMVPSGSTWTLTEDGAASPAAATRTRTGQFIFRGPGTAGTAIWVVQNSDGDPVLVVTDDGKLGAIEFYQAATIDDLKTEFGL